MILLSPLSLTIQSQRDLLLSFPGKGLLATGWSRFCPPLFICWCHYFNFGVSRWWGLPEQSRFTLCLLKKGHCCTIIPTTRLYCTITYQYCLAKPQKKFSERTFFYQRAPIDMWPILGIRQKKLQSGQKGLLPMKKITCCNCVLCLQTL